MAQRLAKHIYTDQQAAIGERLARLDPGGQELLEEASILGERFVFDDLVALQQRDEAGVEAALEAATVRADFGPFDEMLQVVSRPYEDRVEFERYTVPARPEECVRATFCGT